MFVYAGSYLPKGSSFFQADRQAGLVLNLDGQARCGKGQPVSSGMLLVRILRLADGDQRIQDAVELHGYIATNNHSWPIILPPPPAVRDFFGRAQPAPAGLELQPGIER